MASILACGVAPAFVGSGILMPVRRYSRTLSRIMYDLSFGWPVGTVIEFTASHENSGTVLLNINGLGPQRIIHGDPPSLGGSVVARRKGNSWVLYGAGLS